MSSEIDEALSNLQQIKNGNTDDALSIAEDEVDRLFEQHSLTEYIDRQKIHVAVARWSRKNGSCKYDKQLPKQKFGKRVTNTQTKNGHHAIIINERIYDDGNEDGFIDTVRHELAHAICYAIHGESQRHNDNWKQMAQRLGADPSSSHHKRDMSSEYDYYITCTECGNEAGRMKRSKVIQEPFNRMCGKCGHSPLSSYESGQEKPEEDGVVKVDSIPWSNQTQWMESDRKI